MQLLSVLCHGTVPFGALLSWPEDMNVFTVDSKIHDNRTILFFIETGKYTRQMFHCGKLMQCMMYTCIKHLLPGSVNILCLQRFSSIFEPTVG